MKKHFTTSIFGKTISAVLLLAILASSSDAFAQLPGESSNYTPEMVGGQPLSLRGSFAEARNGGLRMDVWRGATNNIVWMSINGGNPFTIGTTQTYVNPTVVPWGYAGFLIFHTGVDGNIYYTGFYDDGTNFGTWYSIPGNTTQMPVSVVQLGSNSNNVYVTYRGYGNDTRVWGIWWGPNGWSTPDNIGGGQALSTPSIAYNPTSNLLWVVAQGTDTRLWATAQLLGSTGWGSWFSENILTYNPPTIGVSSNGNMVISTLNSNNQPNYAVFNAWGVQQTGWSADTSGYRTQWAVQLVAVGITIYALLTGEDGLGYWKPLYNNGR